MFAVLAGCLIAFPPLRVLSWDVFGYYLYLPAHFIYNDLFLQDQTWLQSIMDTYEPSSTFYQLYQMGDGKWVIKYSMGMAVFFAPFFFLAHWLAPMLGYAADGFSAPYQIIIAIGTLLYVFAGLALLRKVLLKFFTERMTGVLLILLVLGTNFLQMVGLGSLLLSHNLAFTLYVLVVWTTIEWHQRPRWNLAFLLGLALGLLALVRPTEALLVLVPLLYGITGTESWRWKLNLAKDNFSHLLNAVFGGLIGIAPQFIYWKSATGNWFHYAYENPGEGFEFFDPYTLEFLFSFRKGWFIYTPIMLLAIIGIPLMKKQQPKLFWGFILFLILDLWVVSSWTCWWYAGGSFSSRSMVPVYCLLLLPLGNVLIWVQNQPRLRVAGGVVISALVILNLFQTHQFRTGIIDGDRMTMAYYFRIFGKTTATAEDRNLLLVKRAFSLDGEILEQPERYTSELWSLRSYENQPNQALALSPEKRFTNAIEKTFEQVTEDDHAWVRISARINPQDSVIGVPPSIVAHFKHGGKPYKYAAKAWPLERLRTGEWTDFTMDYLTPEVRSVSDTMRLYVWNQGGGNFLIDDLKVEIYQPNF